jgi:hypothetical protein
MSGPTGVPDAMTRWSLRQWWLTGFVAARFKLRRSAICIETRHHKELHFPPGTIPDCIGNGSWWKMKVVLGLCWFLYAWRSSGAVRASRPEQAWNDEHLRDLHALD